MSMATYRQRPTRGNHPNDPAWPEHSAGESCTVCDADSAKACPCPWRKPFEQWPRFSLKLLLGVIAK